MSAMEPLSNAVVSVWNSRPLACYDGLQPGVYNGPGLAIDLCDCNVVKWLGLDCQGELQRPEHTLMVRSLDGLAAVTSKPNSTAWCSAGARGRGGRTGESSRSQ
jgi:hypothetical protein